MTERELMAIALESAASLPSVRKWAKGKPLTESVRRSVEAAAVKLGLQVLGEGDVAVHNRSDVA